MLVAAALPYGAGEFIFGEPGTNGQHSFYQLLHQGRTAACELIGIVTPPTDALYGERMSIVGDEGAPASGWGTVSNHDELMSNFFAQADALALGKTAAECEAEGVPAALVPHKTFPGDRVSMQLLLPELSPLSLGHLLGIYEHRTAVQGAVWNINSFDQWGVELGKALATDVRGLIEGGRVAGADTRCVITILNIAYTCRRLIDLSLQRGGDEEGGDGQRGYGGPAQPLPDVKAVMLGKPDKHRFSRVFLRLFGFCTTHHFVLNGRS